ncbi:MAG: uroporphyrinogen decarboxylase family protein [Candidatus Helarchaeota archaeon]
MREDALAALYHEGEPKRVPLYDIKLDDYIIQTIMKTEKVNVNLEIQCLKKLEFDMITAHPLTFGKTEIYDEKTGRRGYIDEWGRKYVYVNGMKYYVEGVLREEDLDTKEWNPDLEVRYSKIKEVIEQADDFAIIGRVGGTFERALLAVGAQKFFTYLYTRPKFIHRLLERINKYWIEVGKQEIDLGVDAILITDDLAYHSGPYLSPKQMEEFIWPTFEARRNAFQKVPIILHTDGNVTSLLSKLCKLVNGVHSLEPTAGMDIKQVKIQYGKKLVLLGNIDCGRLLSYGTPAEVTEVVRKTISAAAPSGGYFLSTSNGVHRGVAIDNLWAMCKARNRFGQYPIQTQNNE